MTNVPRPVFPFSYQQSSESTPYATSSSLWFTTRVRLVMVMLPAITKYPINSLENMVSLLFFSLSLSIYKYIVATTKTIQSVKCLLVSFSSFDCILFSQCGAGHGRNFCGRGSIFSVRNPFCHSLFFLSCVLLLGIIDGKGNQKVVRCPSPSIGICLDLDRCRSDNLFLGNDFMSRCFTHILCAMVLDFDILYPWGLGMIGIRHGEFRTSG